jgi:hypothetical protein
MFRIILKNKNEFLKLVMFALALANIFIFLYALTKIIYLRPISDDYCNAVAVGGGFFDGVTNVFLTWSGDLTVIFVSFVLVGLPLIHLPWSIGSSLAFIAAALMIATTILVLLSELVKIRKKTIFLIIIILIFTVNTWWANLWVTPMLGNNDYSLDISNTLTFWQIINAQYIVTTSLALIFLFYVSKIQNKYSVLYFITGGVITGLGGLVLSTSFLIAGIFSALIYLLKRNFDLFSNYFFYAIGCLIGFISAYFSPGARSRNTVLENIRLKDINIGTIVNWTFPTSIYEAIQALFNLGIFLTFLNFTLLGLLISPYINNNFQSKYKLRLVQIASLLFITTIMSQISELYIYPAFWHQAPLYLLSFLLSAHIGLGNGLYLRTNIQRFYLVTAVFICIILFSIQSYSLVYMTRQIENRFSLWTEGSAPLNGIQDLATESETYVDECWRGLGKLRELPKRES